MAANRQRTINTSRNRQVRRPRSSRETKSVRRTAPGVEPRAGTKSSAAGGPPARAWREAWPGDSGISAEECALLAAIVRSSPDAMIVSRPDGTIISWNRGAERMYGYTADEMVGKSRCPIIPPEETAGWKRCLGRVLRGEEVPQLEVSRLRKDGERLHVAVTLSALKDAEGRVTAVSLSERDITERKRAEDQQKLLLAELDHRVKNTLAVVGSLVTRTLAAGGPPERLAEAIQRRIKAMGKAHQLLTQTHWAGVQIRDIVRQQLEGYRSRRSRTLEVSGPSVLLPPNTALTLSVALHELAANAVKYGALSVPQGRVEVTWRVGEGKPRKRRLALDWRESGGPKVPQAHKPGFGTELITRSIAFELDGIAKLDYRPEGLHCRIEFPLRSEAGPTTSS
jgi:two-component system CheB/CheR fusion protein